MGDIAVPLKEMEVVSVLLSESSKRGYVTYDQILEALPEIENNLSLLDTVLEEIQSAGVPIYETQDDAAQVSSATPKAEVKAEELEEVTPEDLAEIEKIVNEQLAARPSLMGSHAAPLFDLSTVPIDDSVGLYFREMGQQNLLSADEEVELAKKIEAGRVFEEDGIDETTLSWDERDERANVLARWVMLPVHILFVQTHALL